MNDGWTTLYRFHDEQDGLLYVGIAGNSARRFQVQAVTKEWWRQVDWIHVGHCRTRLEAAAAEIEAIRTEQPKYNVAQVTEFILRVAPHLVGIYGIGVRQPPCAGNQLPA